MKRVLIVSCVFPPEPIVSARTSHDLAKRLVGEGYQVAVITSFPTRPGGRLYSAYRKSLFQRSVDPAGFDVLRCFSIPSRESSLPSRFLENFSFGVTSALVALFYPKVDLIYLNTWPIFAQLIAAFAAWLRRIPFILCIQDLYPESLLIQSRFKKDSTVYKLLHKLDTVLAKTASILVVISKQFADVYREDRKIQPDRIHIIPNWIDPEFIRLDVPTEAYRQSQDIPKESFVFAYGGNINASSGIETILESLHLLDRNDGIIFLLAGEGSRLKTCQELAQHIPDRVRFHTPWGEAETSLVLRSAEVLVLSTRDQLSTTSIPSKLLTYMLAARPVIAQALPNTDTANMIQEAKCGWVIAPGDPRLLAQTIEFARQTPPQKLLEMGMAGREFILKNFTDEACLPALLAIFKKLAIQEPEIHFSRNYGS